MLDAGGWGLRGQSPNTSDALGRHDWYSDEYVAEWIRDDERRERNLGVVVERLELRGEEPLVLDVGGGYGRLSRAVLEHFPSARVVLQDFSPPMLARAADYLASFVSRCSFALADLRDSDWTAGLGGPFDAVVSAIAIHNVRDRDCIASVYHDAYRLLRDDGQFLNLDRIEPATLNDHLAWLIEAGFCRVAGDVVGGTQVLLSARRPRGPA